MIRRTMMAASSAPVWTPDATFFAGAAGFAFDPSNYSKAWQDTAGTTPITGVSQLIARLDDLSGNGNNRTQATSGARPQTVTGGYYQFDGVNDTMSGAANTSAGGTWTYIARFNIGSTTLGVTLTGSNAAGAYLGVWQAGSTNNTQIGTTPSLLTVGGTSITDTRGALYTAMTGAMRTFATKTILNNSFWASVVVFGGQPGAYNAIIAGRDLLINRDLTGTDLTNAIAWVNAL